MARRRSPVFKGSLTLDKVVGVRKDNGNKFLKSTDVLKPSTKPVRAPRSMNTK